MHKFADDLQLYISYCICPNVCGQLESALEELRLCIEDITAWKIQYTLKLNDLKTDFLILLSPHHPRTYGLPAHLLVGDAEIKPVTTVRNLGARFDTYLSMKSHVDAVATQCNYHLRHIASIRSYITQPVSQSRHLTCDFQVGLL